MSWTPCKKIVSTPPSCQILDLPSQLFYKNKLSCKARFPFPGPANLPAVKFVCVDGQEEQDEDSPSYYNSHEAIKIAEEVSEVVKVFHSQYQMFHRQNFLLMGG